MTVRTRINRRPTTNATPTPQEADWRVRGACRWIDPDLFWPIGESAAARNQAEQAKEVCNTCPVRAQCLEYALANQQDAGVWGGTTERERRALHGRRRRSGPEGASAVNQILTERLDLFQDAVARGLQPGEIARELRTNPQTVCSVLDALADGVQLDAASVAVAA